MILFSLCDIPWWLLWLLPLLLAVLLWWWQDDKYNRMVADYENKVKGLNGRIDALEDELTLCKRRRSELEGDLALTKGRMREMEAEMQSLRTGGPSKEVEKGGFIASSSAGLGAVASSLAAGTKEKSASKGGVSKSIFAKIKSENLQIIEGIGPKMESVLKENGVDSHAALGSMSVDEIQAILDKYGDKYKIIDPKTWGVQAKLAGDGDFEGLISLQKKLDAGKDTASGMTDSKLEKYLIKIGALKAFKQDDLKAIEGIGPATDKLLRENGINTWRDLADSTAESIKTILTEAGPRFALGDPTTWPKQAELAADGKFDELREYQDFLDGGKE